MAARLLAAQLGYAWRRSRKPGGFYHKALDGTAAGIVADLHAEALARLGSQLRPLSAAPLDVQLARADPRVREAIRHLGQLASSDAERVAVEERSVEKQTHPGLDFDDKAVNDDEVADTANITGSGRLRPASSAGAVGHADGGKLPDGHVMEELSTIANEEDEDVDLGDARCPGIPFARWEAPTSCPSEGKARGPRRPQLRRRLRDASSAGAEKARRKQWAATLQARQHVEKEARKSSWQWEMRMFRAHCCKRSLVQDWRGTLSPHCLST